MSKSLTNMTNEDDWKIVKNDIVYISARIKRELIKFIILKKGILIISQKVNVSNFIRVVNQLERILLKNLHFNIRKAENMTGSLIMQYN